MGKTIWLIVMSGLLFGAASYDRMAHLISPDALLFLVYVLAVALAGLVVASLRKEYEMM